jgi:hypothetical protein
MTFLVGCGSSAGEPSGIVSGDSGAGGSPDATQEASGTGDSAAGSDATSSGMDSGAGDASVEASLDGGGGVDSSVGPDGSSNDAGNGGDGGGSDGASDGGASDGATPSDAASDVVVPVTFGASCDGSSTALTGTVYAPNGVDPIPNVRVYAAITINPYPANYCDKCSSPIDPAYASTTSAADGTFTLHLDAVPVATTIDFAIQIGRFRKHTTLPVTACTLAAVPAAAETLPGNSTAGDIPKIAVSSGNVDHLDVILAALGITEYDCYEGRKTAGASTATCNETATGNATIADVLASSATLGSYNMAFLSCAPDAYKTFIGTHSQATMTANTASWVAGGGRLFVTDTAYDYIAQAFPSSITWAGGAGSPQPVDGANLGCSPPNNTTGPTTAYNVTVDDPTLTTWLQIVGFPSSPNVSVSGFYNPWSLISSLPATTTLIANGSIPVDLSGETNVCTTSAPQNVPLTAQFDVPSCGRVVFSSYHTLSNVSTNSLTAQEKIMEYLIFYAATCYF